MRKRFQKILEYDFRVHLSLNFSCIKFEIFAKNEFIL